MKPRASLGRAWLIAAIASTFAAACGDSNGGSSQPTPQATNTSAPAATATPTHQAGNVSGLLVLNRSVSAGTSDALGAPPQQWMESKDSGSFDRSLAAANWSIDGGAVSQGVSGPDGRFTTSGLSPGPHTLQVTKTLGGDLASVSVPFTVGDDGSADLVIEVAWGSAKSTNTYIENGAQIREVDAPNGSWAKSVDGRVAAIGDPSRTLVDPQGDGTFVMAPCAGPSTCDEACQVTIHKAAPPPAAPPCNPDHSCSAPGDVCFAVFSCPGCNDSPALICLPQCIDLQISAISISGPSQLIVGQSGSVTATALLSDGGTFDVTFLVDWTSSDLTTATVDSWGTVSAVKVGSTSISATLGTLTSAPWPIEVTARPPLRKIDVQNVSCVFPMGASGGKDGSLPPAAVPAPRSDVLPVPDCSQVLQIGATIQFRAIGEFDNGYYQDITDEVQWQVAPPEVGSVAAGLFTAQQAGTTALTATLDGVVSDGTKIRVVTQPTVIALSIYADNGGFAVIQGIAKPAPVTGGMPCLTVGPAEAAPCCCPGPLAGDSAAPCRCNYAITVLRGDQLKFHATAQYDTGAWQDVTSQVTWRSSDASVAAIDAGGVMTAVQGGDASIDAVFENVTSDPVSVRVVNEATLLSLYIYQEGNERVVAKGAQLFFHATGYYDVGISRDATTEAVWHSSDEAVGGFDSPGVFTGRSAGTVQVWAELDGQKSSPASLEVFETSELAYCDPNNINRAVWSDDFNRVTLESDCAFYNEPGVATLRYSVTEIQPHGGIFNPCLDLYVFAGKTKVRTIREQGCGAPFLAGAPAPDEALKYQLRAFWDLKDETGAPVPPGTYTIYGRFYLYYDPVVSLDVTVLAPGQPTPTSAPTLPVTPTAVCTPPACPAGAALVCAQRGTTTGTPGGDLGCCPDGWDLYPCTFAGGGTGLACHNPAMGCPSSEVCGEGCDSVVTGTCDGCSDGCGYICVSGTPLPTPNAPGCDVCDGRGCVLPDGLSGNCLVQLDGCACVPEVTPITPAPVCTPPKCDVGEVLQCPGYCAGGCGYVCGRKQGTPLPTPTPAAWLKVVVATGQPGEAVTFAVSLTAAGQRVARVENYLIFNPNIGIGAKPDGTPDCTVNPDIHKNATAFSFLTVGDETWMRARVYDNGNSDPIPDGAILYTCTVNIAPTAPPATYPMIIWSATGTTPEGATLAILGQEGAIVVTGTPKPTCTPPPCGPGEVFHCPGPCLGNCGMTCGTPTATPPPTPTLAPITLVAGSTSGQPGEMVSFAVSMSAKGEKVWGVGNDLTFDPLTAIAATADGEPDCSANPQTHKMGLFNFQPVGCSAGQCNRVRALVLSIMSMAPIPGDMVLYTCNVRIRDDAASGSYPLVVSRTDASTTDARTLPVNSTDGEIVVLAPDGTVPPTPTTPMP
jgi:Bacterial Ig-like domain (group 2)